MFTLISKTRRKRNEQMRALINGTRHTRNVQMSKLINGMRQMKEQIQISNKMRQMEPENTNCLKK
jgi:hypothetical protein